MSYMYTNAWPDFVLIYRGSAEDVLQALQFVYQEYDKVAAYHNVFTALIKKEDPTRLQKGECYE